MKRLLVAALCALGFASAYAEPLDHWLYADGKITDGAWTFSATADNNKKMTVGQVSETAGEYPTVLTPLDFSKPVKDSSENTYVITTLDCKFIDNSKSYAAREPAQYVSALTLPGEGLTRVSDYSLGKLVNAVGTLHFPASLTSFGRMAFQEDAQLTVAGSEFANVKSLTSGDAFKNVNITGELDLRKLEGKVENNSFAGTKITSVLFGPGLTDMQGGYQCGAFADCAKLKTVVFDPASSVKVGPGAVFRNCTALEELDLRAASELWTSPDDGHLNSPDYAPFNNCTGLKKVVLGGSMPRWSYIVFAGCSSLSEVHCYGAPSGELGSPVFGLAGDNRMIATFVHLDPSDTAAKAAWNAYTAGGELNATDSCWKDEMITGSTGALRPLHLYSVKHVSLERGVDADMESGVIGTFIVSRAEGDSLAGAVDVAYTLSGTAVNGVDYETLSGVVSIPNGERSVYLQVIPRFIGAVSTKDMAVTLAEGDYEIVSGKESATISVSSCYRSVSVAKLIDADEGKGTYGWFEISRGEGDAVTTPLAVEFAVSGTANPGKTYRTLESPVVIPAGERSVKLRVTPLDDQDTTTDTTVIVTVTGDNYAIEGDPATMTIVNGATFGGWKLYGSYMTDGVWKFTVQQNTSQPDRRFADGTCWLYVQTLQSYPAVPSELNFDKVMINCDNEHSLAIREFQSSLNAAAAVLKSVVLPNDDRYPFVLGGALFEGCSNLESITPFLPKSCESVGRGVFNDLTSLTNANLRFFGSDFGEKSGWEIMRGCTSITNADFSASTITALRRDCFQNCTSLKTVTLPTTLKEFGWPGNTDLGTMNRTPFNGVGGVKVIFTGGVLPVMTYQDGNVAAIEFTTPVAELPDNAFANYYSIYSIPRLSSITFVGPPPATIGSDLFTGGYKDRSITVNVSAEYISQWREIADGEVLTKEDGGTWTSGTKQLIKVYGEVKVKTGLLIIVR